MNVNLSKYNSIVIYGLGKSGLSCLKFLISQGYSDVFLTDDSPNSILAAKKMLNSEFPDYTDIDSLFIEPVEVAGKINTESKVVLAPGIPLYFPKRHPILDITEDSCLVSDIELFSDIFLDRRDVGGIFNIGVTGTNGKSTICSFVDYILQGLGLNSLLVGNIGVPIFDVASRLLDAKETEGVCLVTEISSFQLDLLKDTRFNASCISNISDDHVERHGSFENYVNSKLRIFKNATKDDFSIVNYGDPLLKRVYDENFLSRCGSTVIRTSPSEKVENSVAIFDNFLHVNLFDFDLSYDISAMAITGKHNQENYCAVVASILCYLKKSDLLTRALIDDLVQLSMSFTGIKHRMQFLGVKDGVKFVNDSKATNPVSVNSALDAYDNNFLIIGGYDKGADLDVMKNSLSKITKAYIIGESTERIEKFLKKNDVKYENCINLDIAFNKSFIDAKKHDSDSVVMLSPGCASYDQWRNFEERGDYFCKLFNEIK